MYQTAFRTSRDEKHESESRSDMKHLTFASESRSPATTGPELLPLWLARHLACEACGTLHVEGYTVYYTIVI